MNIAPISSIHQVSSYVQLKPLIKAIVETNDNLPKTSLPTEVPGSVQSQVSLLPKVTLYTQHGKIAKSTEPGNLIAYA
jgi:hypothetical protein